LRSTGVFRLGRLGERDIDRLRRIQGSDDAPAKRERVAVVRGVVVGNPRFPGVDVGAAQFLGRDHLPGRRLHQRRAAEKDGPLIAHDHGLVRHRRDVGATRRARAHDHGDLGDPGGRQGRLVVEDSPEMLAIREDLGPMRKIGAPGIHEIDAGEPVLARDLLGPDVLFDRHRVVSAAFDGGIVADDHAFAAGDATDAGDDAGGVNRVLVHAIGGKGR
jgi:hypothetical protein